MSIADRWNSGEVLDVAVVGGGIGGLYSCFQLLKESRGEMKVALFEGSHRFGGRIETVAMDGFLAEYGPMRFERRAQPILMALIDELGLETSYFPPYLAANDPESLYFPDADDRLTCTARVQETGFTTLELLTVGILRVLRASSGNLDDPIDPRHQAWWEGLDEDYYRYVRTEASFQGELLFETGFWNVLSEVLSHRALTKIINYGTFYHEIHQNPSAAESIIFWLRGLHPKDHLVGIRQGVEALVAGLTARLSSITPAPPTPAHGSHPDRHRRGR